MKIQYGILAVLLFGFIDYSSWFFYRLGTNNTGYYNISALVFVVFLANVQRTIARVLYLVISMGFGIVKWTLGNTKIKIIILGFFSLIFSFLLQCISEIESLEEQRVIASWITLVVAVCSSVLDICFYYWIVLSLIRTIQQLTLRRQILKLDMYKAFLAVLILSGVFSGLLILYTILAKFEVIRAPWQNRWIDNTFWHLLYLLVTVTTAVLWRPRQNNLRYGYAEFFEKEEDDLDKNIPMTIISSSGTETKMRKRPKKEEYDTDREKNIEKTKPKFTEFEQGILSFDLASEDESVETIQNEIRKME